MLIEIDLKAGGSPDDAAPNQTESGTELLELLRDGKATESAKVLEREYRVNDRLAQSAARLLTRGLPVQVQDIDERWLTFAVREELDAVTQRVLLEGMRALATTGRSTEAADWYRTEFPATTDLSWEAVLLLQGKPLREVEPSGGGKRRQRRRARLKWAVLFMGLLVISAALGIALAVYLGMI